MLKSIFATLLLFLPAQTQNIHLPGSTSPGLWTGAIQQSHAKPRMVRVELDGRNMPTFCAHNLTPNGPSVNVFHETQALRIIVGPLVIEAQGDPADVTLTLTPNGMPGDADCATMEAVFNVNLEYTDAATLAIFTGDGTLPVRVEWNTDPHVTANGNVEHSQSDEFSGRLNFIYL